MDRQILVHVDLDSTPHFVGRLWARRNKGRDSASFEYAEEWLANSARFALEPALTLSMHSFHTMPGRSLFGAFGDSAPDRWGRILIQRNELRQAREENRARRTLLEADYLLGVGDIARMGALRFSTEEGGPFLAAGDAAQIPPLVRLSELLTAAMQVSSDGGTDADLKLLLAPGSSLGGARPKASIIDRDGSLAIAKFPRHDDIDRVILWEAVALTLAHDSGINTAHWRIEPIGEHPVLVLRRFDRHGENRVPFLSAMSMIDAADNEEHSYLEIADALRRYGAKPEEDLAELWRRIVFNILIANTDDHLRNHGMLYDPAGGGWRLSPAYDLNPTPIEIKQRYLSLAIDEADNTGDIALALSVAKQFGVKPNAANQIVTDVSQAVSNWRRVAISVGLSSREIERMASAFAA